MPRKKRAGAATRIFSVRLTGSEITKLRACAKRSDMDLSTWVRTTVLRAAGSAARFKGKS